MPFQRNRVLHRSPSKDPPRKTLIQGVLTIKEEPSTPEEPHHGPSSARQSPFPVTLNPDSLGFGSDPASGSRRRSIRLASKSNPIEIGAASSGPSRHINVKGKGEFEVNVIRMESVVGVVELGELGNGVRASDSGEGKVGGVGDDVGALAVRVKECMVAEEEEGKVEEGARREMKKKEMRKSGDLLDVSDCLQEEIKRATGFLSLRSGTKIMKRVGNGRKVGAGFDESGRRDSIVDDLVVKREEINGGNNRGKEIIFNWKEENDAAKTAEHFGPSETDSTLCRQKPSREEKGKGKMAYDDVGLDNEGSVDLELKLGRQFDLNVPAGDMDVEGASLMLNAAPDAALLEVASIPRKTRSACRSTPHEPSLDRKKRMQEHFKRAARDSAARFAHFNAEEENLDPVTSSAQREVPLESTMQEIEDWPGPFSTAMRIIQDREKKVHNHEKNLTMDKDGVLSIQWSPRKEQCNVQKKPVPLLQDLCMSVLVENVDAITSLQFIPDSIRHKLSQMLCDSRKMSVQFFDLLIQGTPLEIRLRDCSWTTEEQFTRSFEVCNTSKLTVLQLDQCGRCMPDYTLLATLAHKRLPALTAISLKGACRLSDTGLSALVSSAPALRSINLSQCSLLTAVGINYMVNSLESNLYELYLDDCQTVDVMHVLPALKRLQNLQVLSLAGIPSVCDQFVRELIGSNGDKMKELILADCVNLTDSSLKVIAENCSVIRALDVVNVRKLTDVGIGYLAGGLQAIESLKFCRNKFSDEAIAAFLETCGQSLKELSLNNVVKVSYHTALSLAKCCRNLESLDLSWCRSLTDEALGLIADSCFLLRLLRLFGCTQVSRKFLDGHSNLNLEVIGLKLTPILARMTEPNELGPLRYSSTF